MFNIKSEDPQHSSLSAGSVSHELAISKANEEYDKFKVKQDQEYISDFDEELEKYLKGEENPS